MNRRDLLTAVPVAVAALAVPAAAEVETPVMRLFREWQAARDAEEATASADEAAYDAAWEVRYAVEKRLMAEPSQNGRDWMLKVCAWSYWGEGGGPDTREAPQLWAEARALIAA
ncbi:hypothetical protein ACEYYB_11430 [Paracoccus sp. p4-l81]|uniref:hypothetical protein n=1 Tax=Paracoccus sp. p4-l81 TaxID=3342806 RepID=UPI0035B9AD91